MQARFVLAALLTLPVAGCPSDSNPTAPAAIPHGAPPVFDDAAAPTITNAAARGAKLTKEEKEAARRTFAAQLALIDREIEGARKLSQKNVTVLPWDKLARAYMARAKLTGNYEDYAQADKALEVAFTKKENFGPWLTRAGLNYHLHRMDRVDTDLQKAKKIPLRDLPAQADLLTFEAKVAMQRGEYKTALGMLERSLQIYETYNARVALALHHWKSNNYEEAEALFRKAFDDYHGQETEPLAWLHLMLGLMDLDRGRYDEALAHYREGEELIKGYWLIEEHIAEILTLQGKTDEAKAMYEDIIARTNNPEFMDAMAGILLEEGKEAEAKEWIAKARSRYEEQLAQFPEAAYGHALEHFLEFGDDPAQVVELAEKNHKLRPNAEAKILLAQAYLKAERPKDAEKIIKQALKTPWNTADLHAVAAEVFLATGKSELAKKHALLARAINPALSAEPEGQG